MYNRIIAVIALFYGVHGWAMPVFEGFHDGKPVLEAKFEQTNWTRHWNTNKQYSAFKVKPGPGYQGKGAVLSHSAVTNRGKFSSPSFTVPVGTSIHISVKAKAKGYEGGLHVNMEQPNEKPVASQPEFFIAGGSSDWITYEHRMLIKPKGAANGKPVKLKLWFYMYGKGSITIDDLAIRIIQPDPRAKLSWLNSQIKKYSKRFGLGPVPVSANNKSVVEAIDPTKAIQAFDAMIKHHATTASSYKDWGVLTTHAMARVLRDQPFYHDYNTEVSLTMARHEFEGAQVCLFAFDKPLTDVSVTVSDLKGPAILAKQHIQVLPVVYGDASKLPRGGFFEGQHSQWIPDALVSNRKFSVAQNTIQPVYIRAYVPPSTKPGTYQGTISIKAQQGEAHLPLSITVSKATLPKHLTLKTMLLGGRGQKPEHKAYLDLALENRMPPGKIFTGMSWNKPNFPRKGKSYDFSGVEKRLQYAIDRGLNAFAMATTPKSGKWGFPKTYSPKWKQDMKHVVSEYSRWLKKKGWFDKAYYYNIDEPWDNRWGQVKDIYTMVKSVDKHIQVMSCVNKIGALENLKNHADAFDVYMQQYHRQQGDARKRDKKEMWWAICIWPDEKPNIFITSPLPQARMIGWISYAYHMDGFEYWDMNSWTADWKKGSNAKPPMDESWLGNMDGYLLSSWPYSHYRAGDGYLTYPGNNHIAHNSLRFEVLRDGLEEHELLTMAHKKNARAVDDIIKSMVTNVHVFEESPESLMMAREKIFGLLRQ